jgi:hypothetical protein
MMLHKHSVVKMFWRPETKKNTISKQHWPEMQVVS